MNYVIPNVSISPKQGKFCIYSIMEFIMSHYKYDISNTDLFFLCNGMHVTYQSDLNFIGYDSIENTLLNLVKSGYFKLTTRFEKDKMMSCFDEAFDQVQKDNLVLLLVGTKGLTYHRVFTENEINRGHSIILYGMDTEKDTLYIGDSYIKDYNGQLLSYQGTASFKEIGDRTFGIAWFDMSNKIELTRRDILITAIKNMKEYIEGSEAEDLYSGNTALKRFISDLGKLYDLDDEVFSTTCMNIYFNIRMRSIVVILEYLIEFIETNKEFQAEGWEELGKQIREVLGSWNGISVNILKISRTKRRGGLAEIIDFCGKTLKIQDEVLDRYVSYLERIKENLK